MTTKKYGPAHQLDEAELSAVIVLLATTQLARVPEGVECSGLARALDKLKKHIIPTTSGK